MTPANRAVFRSKSIGLADTLQMEPAEVVSAVLRLAVEYSPKAGIDRQGLLDLLDNAAQAAIEGSSPSRQVGGTDGVAP